MIVDFGVPDNTYQHVVRAGHGPGGPLLGQLVQGATHVVCGQVSQRDVPGQHQSWLLVWLCFAAFKIAIDL